MTVSNCSSVVSANGAYNAVPALLIKKSKLGEPVTSFKWAVASFTNASKLLTSPVFNCNAMAFCPNASISATTLSASLLLLFVAIVG